MELDPENAISAIQTGIQQASTLIVTYSFSVLGAILLLVIGFVVAGLVERWVYAGLGQVSGFDLTLRRFFSKIARYIVLGLIVVMVLGQFGIQTASVIAAIGAVGLAIGLALQGTLQNIAAGIMLLALRPLRIGEYVEVGSVAGTVEEIGLFATRLRAADGVYVLAPNSTLWTQPVKNFTRNGARRNDITITVSNVDDVESIQKSLLELAERDARVKTDPPPSAFIAELGDTTAAITLRYWTSVGDFLATKAELNRGARNALNANV
ncbi:mechanosensitive ion channel protein [Phyllobacterium brassicacearum]|uniref:Small-conductance mechanosensitive channel n=1 Tax=Phyllobacterium brassicacearum TaxID=314235 RepID=A0A2P7BRP9_9HYPH|nr:mechanosensitive ion channel family protein [Phyllobacterium brassicacearum]PSH69135.1 mechanosensitive ion channel protein [Phyllobacterium brassicacearum]TDQ22648.1 small conductance mechanosensitive channel [Phyllobacterium brassicacearum]